MFTNYPCKMNTTFGRKGKFDILLFTFSLNLDVYLIDLTVCAPTCNNQILISKFYYFSKPLRKREQQKIFQKTYLHFFITFKFVKKTSKYQKTNHSITTVMGTREYTFLTLTCIQTNVVKTDRYKKSRTQRTQIGMQLQVSVYVLKM